MSKSKLLCTLTDESELDIDVEELGDALLLIDENGKRIIMTIGQLRQLVEFARRHLPSNIASR